MAALTIFCRHRRCGIRFNTLQLPCHFDHREKNLKRWGTRTDLRFLTLFGMTIPLNRYKSVSIFLGALPSPGNPTAHGVFRDVLIRLFVGVPPAGGVDVFIDGSGALSPMLIECVTHFLFYPVLGERFPRPGSFASRTKAHLRASGFNSSLDPGAAGGGKNMASRGVNKVILVCNLGADPDIRYLPTGGMVTAIRLATGETWKDQNGQQQERTEWHRVVFYRRLAEVAGEFLKKGSKIYVEGSLRTQQWDKDGEKRYNTEVIAKELHMLDRASEHDEAQGPSGQQNPGKPKQNRSPSSQSSANHQSQPQPVAANVAHALDNFDEYDDDSHF